ncbi:MAG: YheT family hydrolase [Isosphaeraceae bacterium]
MLIHGLAGSADAPYVARLAGLLFVSGTRVVRMNLRGAGSGFDKARGTYHAGRTEDVRRVAAWAAEGAPGSPIGLVGFSLGGNLALKLAAEAGNTPLPGLDCVVAANPPIDLAASCRYIQRPGSRVYDRQFVKLLVADVKRRHRTFPDLGPVAFPKLMSLFDFDERYTAPRNGFQGARDYYARSSSRPLIPGIRVPGLVIHSEDDPFIPVEPFLETVFPENLSLELTPSGGHLGYLSRASWNGSRRWLDHRIMTWLKTRWGCGFAPDLVA